MEQASSWSIRHKKKNIQKDAMEPELGLGDIAGTSNRDGGWSRTATNVHSWMCGCRCSRSWPRKTARGGLLARVGRRTPWPLTTTRVLLTPSLSSWTGAAAALTSPSSCSATSPGTATPMSSNSRPHSRLLMAGTRACATTAPVSPATVSDGCTCSLQRAATLQSRRI